MNFRSLIHPYRLAGTLAVLLCALPAAKSNGCGPDVPIGSDTLGEPCGTSVGVDCGAGEYCRADYSCGGEGVCTTVDANGVCATILDPVCGCDGKTYGNACEAMGHGISVEHDGACGGSGVCGGFSGQQCDQDEYCNYVDGSCGIADQTGVCVPLAEGCFQVFLPVCGCDGNTYGNACEAAAAGMSVASDGPCTPAGTACGGFSGNFCTTGEYCDYPMDTCGIADEQGTCKPSPSACDTEFDPVCGCDGNDYGNACEASAAGTDVASAGPCPS